MASQEQLAWGGAPQFEARSASGGRSRSDAWQGTTTDQKLLLLRQVQERQRGTAASMSPCKTGNRAYLVPRRRCPGRDGRPPKGRSRLPPTRPSPKAACAFCRLTLLTYIAPLQGAKQRDDLLDVSPLAAGRVARAPCAGRSTSSLRRSCRRLHGRYRPLAPEAFCRSPRPAPRSRA